MVNKEITITFNLTAAFLHKCSKSFRDVLKKHM